MAEAWVATFKTELVDGRRFWREQCVDQRLAEGLFEPGPSGLQQLR